MNPIDVYCLENWWWIIPLTTIIFVIIWGILILREESWRYNNE